MFLERKRLHTRYSIVFSLLSFSLLNFSCQRPISTLSTPVPSSVTPKPIIEGQNNNSIQSITNSTNSTKRKTSVPQNTIPPFPSLPGIESFPSDYTLKYPFPETILRLQLYQSSQLLSGYESSEWEKFVTVSEILDFIWKNAYAQHGYSSELYAMLPNYYDHSNGRASHQMLIDIIGDYLLEQLNQEEIHLTDRTAFWISDFWGTSYKVEIDNDSMPEWLLKIEDPTGFYLSQYTFWIALDQLYPGNFYRLINQTPWQFGKSLLDSPKGFRGDLTGNGLTDFAIIEEVEDPIGTTIRAHIGIGSSEGYRILPTSISFYHDKKYIKNKTTYQWQTGVLNATPSLVITSTHKLLPWDCDVTVIYRYTWQGGVESREENLKPIPKTTQCTIAQAKGKYSPKTNEESIAILTDSLNSPVLLEPEYQTYINFNLSLLHSLIGDIQHARGYISNISTLASDYPGSIASHLWEYLEINYAEDTILPYKLCLAAESIALDIPERYSRTGNLNPTSYPYAGFPAGFPSPLCDTRDLLEIVLDSVHLTPDTTLPASLQAVGIPVKELIPISLESGEKYWFVIIEDNNPGYLNDPPDEFHDNDLVIIYRYSYSEGWKKIGDINQAFDNLILNIEDLTHDGIPDITLVYPSESASACEQEQTNFHIFATTTLKSKWVISFSDPRADVCLPTKEDLDFSLFYQDLDGDGESDWIIENLENLSFDVTLLDDYETMDHWIVHHVPDSEIDPLLNQRLILEKLSKDFSKEGKLPAYRENIMFFLNHLDLNDDNRSRYIQANLSYLLALSFEVSGDEITAIQWFYDTWKNYPSSIWGFLAASHLQHK